MRFFKTFALPRRRFGQVNRGQITIIVAGAGVTILDDRATPGGATR